MTAPIVIVGAGQAGGGVASALRDEGFEGRVVLIGEEETPPYERPPLSKKLLIGVEGPESTYLNNRSYYENNRIELRLGTRAERLDRARQRLRLGDGSWLDYDQLVLTTGSMVRRISLPGSDLPGIHYLRRLDDSMALRRVLTKGARISIIGGGYIGLEVAAAARTRGCRVTVLEAEEVVMNRVVAPEIGRFMMAVHQQHGVDIRTGVTVVGLAGADHVEGVVRADGNTVATDTVVVGIGVFPDTELASQAGLDVADGIIVDGRGQTSDPKIFAAGDVTNQPAPLGPGGVRLESWQNAQNQAIAVARSLCGKAAAETAIPWFWSDQFEINLQIVGLPTEYDELVFRGDPASHRFTAFYLRDRRVVTANAINNGRDIRPARQLIGSKRRLDPVVLADPETSLRTLIREIPAASE